MKHIAKILIIFILVFTITGCGTNESSRNADNNRNSVDKVINKQMESFKTDRVDSSLDGQGAQDESVSVKSSPEVVPQETDGQIADEVDYDLTTMNSDMVYATVYQMMVDPDTYIGKTFRMDGLYYASYYELTAQYYHYCIIRDATACCAQGLEFVWGDGSHVYPDEYPTENTEVVVQGVFETYREDGDANLHCRLRDATLEVVDN